MRLEEREEGNVGAAKRRSRFSRKEQIPLVPTFAIFKFSSS